MERGRVQSLKRRIGLADHSKLKEIADELLSEGSQTPKELVEALTQRLRKEEYLDSSTMGKLIVLFRDRDLYQVPHTKSMFLDNVDVLVAFLRAGIPDRQIEERLCERLARDFDKNAYGFRQFILEALRDCGSIDCLDTLEAIDYDFHGHYRTTQTVVDALGGGISTADSMNYGADLTLGRLVKECISAVQARNFLGEYEWSDPPPPGIALFSQVDEYIALARGHLDGDPGAALNNIRKAIESLLKTVIKLLMIKPRSSDPIEKMQLPGLIGTVMSESKKVL